MVNPHFLVVGLGNITFPTTRHSLGHFMIDVLANRLGAHLSSERSGWAATTSVDIRQAVTLTFFKPRALMNISGRPVVDMLRKTAINPASLIVIHDSLDHKPCVVSPKFGGSANGHNGVRSIVAALGNNPDFHRLRLGIGRGRLSGADITDYVLGPLSAQEREFWSANGPGPDVVWRELARIVEKTVAAAR
ncbi:peptidyl-tRNA hydrolase [Dichomitus squalens]|uniref:peptidyl-tRNA hydrolase n=1 Tax=Dichomitus squalens (strain LYAD-421) TaxID=732165 RepID=UPI0004412EFF|nr:peptidyl-tRNA hydrolase [Dichomitus squalens LYAD-421 SS1]EJF65461.1 peptidyl-tRNA hydrolase [Dichomitus squalens LYAD-421 SS1]TBU45770.1 peptidyl-tRNA hydrolase [Dichomitus squalens]